MIVAEDFSQPLDFCVQTVVRDGLRVAPFGWHPDGDHSLRDLGLDSGTWRRWLDAVLQAQARLDEAGATLGAEMAAKGVAQPEALEALPAARDAARPLLQAPYAWCPGSNPLRAGLARLWAEDQPRMQVAERRLTSPKAMQRRSRGLWKGLEALGIGLEGLKIYLIDYPSPTVMPVAPSSCLIAPGDDHQAQVRFAAEQLGLGRGHLQAG